MMTVVGIVDDVSDVDLLQPPEPTLYAAWTQTANVAFPMGLVLRTAGDPEALAPALRAAVSERRSDARAGSDSVGRDVPGRVAGAANVSDDADAGARGSSA